MNSSPKKKIALLSVHADPTIAIDEVEAGQEEIYINGQSVYVGTLGLELSRQGFSVDMFTRKTTPEQPNIVKHNDYCRTIRLTTGAATFVQRDDLFAHLPNFVESLLSFQEESDIQYDLFHTNYWLSGWVGLQLKRILGVKQVHTYHSLGAVKYNAVSHIPPVAKTRLYVEKECLEEVDCVIATTPQEKEHMRSLVSRKGTIEVIACGTDIQSFGGMSRPQARQRLEIPSDSKVVLFVGRFDARKGIETVVRAVSLSRLREYADLRLIIVGNYMHGEADEGEYLRIKNLIDQLGIGHLTSFQAHVYHDHMPVYYASADVCVVPSHYEPFGLVAIEAMASGVPVVASDVGGLQFTVVPEETGLLIPPKHELEFAKAIDRMLTEPQWSNTLGENGRERVKKLFNIQGAAFKLRTLYMSILE